MSLRVLAEKSGVFPKLADLEPLKPLTDQAIKKAKAGPRPIKMSDGHGLYLLVTEAASKLWRWKYRILGKEKGLFFGGP